ncbi:hypothetical protein [Mycolicibacterium tusciae]|uniref:hypothetical protein n=1 Tax=Mycolicibacterium tusciae TaxID=75922 RepID=UPI00024A3ABC|nr:hypothetical protein [Mycolicibacterium tusciae]
MTTPRIDRTLPHHPALGLVLYTQPRRLTALDDRTPAQIERDAQAAASHASSPTCCRHGGLG